MAEEKRPELRHIQITLHKDGVIAPALGAVQTSTDVVGFCLSAIQEGDLTKRPEIQGAFFQMLVPSSATVDERRIGYANWLLSRGFQDLARGIRLTLEEAYFYNSVIELVETDGRIRMSGGTFQRHLDSSRERASRLNFPELMAAVN